MKIKKFRKAESIQKEIKELERQKERIPLAVDKLFLDLFALCEGIKKDLSHYDDLKLQIKIKLEVNIDLDIEEKNQIFKKL